MVALQALFEVDSVGHQPGVVIQERLLENPLPDKAASFMRRLVTGTLAGLERYDRIIARYAPEWPVEQIPIVDRNILRMALYELENENTPVKVVINEAVEVAKTYGGDNSPRFVNGVLGSVVRNEAVDLRKDEREKERKNRKGRGKKPPAAEKGHHL
jgi:N utilization substance protein B